MDDYVEQIVAKKQGGKELLIKIAMIAFAALLIFAGMFVLGNTIVTIVGIIAAVACFILIPDLNVEYEYLYLDKEFSVDRILNKEKRRKAGNFPLDKMEIMAPINSHSLDSYNGRVNKTYDFSSGEAEAKKFAIIINDGGCIKIIIEPDEKMLRIIKDHFPRKVAEF